MQSAVLSSAKIGAHCAGPPLHKRGGALRARTLQMVLRNMGKTSRKLLVAKLLASLLPSEVLSLSSSVFVRLVVNISVNYAQLFIV